MKGQVETPSAQGRGAATTDAAVWTLNVSTSVLIVFVNKLLMDPLHGYGFVFASCLCSLHFFVSGAAARAWEALSTGMHTRLPIKDVLAFSAIAGISVASLNLSLLVNSVGFYQISKLLIIPFVCVVEAVWLRRRYTAGVLASMVVVILGVAVVTVTDMSINPLGFMIAMLSVVSSGMQQIMCGTVQRKFNVTSTQLLSNTAPIQGALLLMVGPGIDHLLSGVWVTSYQFTVGAVATLTASCAIAVLVNISQFMCLGRFSALTFQVLGHAKTVLVLLVGWGFLHDSMNPRKLMGMVLAVTGMVLYGWLNSFPAPAQPSVHGPAAAPLTSTGSLASSHASKVSSMQAREMQQPLLDLELGTEGTAVITSQLRSPEKSL